MFLMKIVIFFVVFTHPTLVRSTIAASVNEVQAEIEDILQTYLLSDCSQYVDDSHIIDSFPFIAHNTPAFRDSTRTFAWKNENGNIVYMNIANQICVPSIIYCLKHLVTLDIRNTRFCDYEQQLPIKIEYFPPSLIHLGIYDTKIEYLPEQITKQTQLQELTLSNTGLTILPDSIDRFSSLTVLYLSNNSLTSIPNTIKNIQSLQKITLSNNPNLISIKPLNGLPSLTKLDTRNSPIQELPRNLPQLTDLSMSNNNLNSLTGIETLGNGTNSNKSFTFNMNHIRYVSSKLQDVRNLYQLNLNHNQLNNLPTDIFNITSLSHLHIQRNHFRPSELQTIRAKFKITNPKLKLYV